MTRRVQLGFSCVVRRLLWRAFRCTQKYTFISFCCVSLPTTICFRVSHLCKVYEDTAGVIVRECVYSECKELVVVVEVWFESPSLGRENYQTGTFLGGEPCRFPQFMDLSYVYLEFCPRR